MAFQRQRTEAAAQSTEEMWRVFQASIAEEFPEGEPQKIPLDVPDTSESVRLALSSAGMIAQGLSDLRAHVMLAPLTASVVTSDNPVHFYNKYCEGISEMGVTGANCRGLQAFLPLSPEACLVMFDDGVYTLSGRRAARPLSKVTDADVEQVNLLQALSARENLYLNSSAPRATSLPDLTAMMDPLRSEAGWRVHKADEEVEAGTDSPGSTLVHFYPEMPNADLRLSFRRLKVHVKQIPLFDRANLYRREIPLVAPGPPRMRGKTVTFHRRDED